MTDFNWCHGPNCHKQHTQDRIRGVKGSKVLRTRKVKISNYGDPNMSWNWFCSNHCQNDFWKTYATQIVAIAPMTECKETPINVTKETTDNPYWGRRVETKIEVDETRQS